LGCCEWNEKSDIWSIACILAELYTGELFFPTHDNEEHLALIEKACGKNIILILIFNLKLNFILLKY
jgi:hypothetical protein